MMVRMVKVYRMNDFSFVASDLSVSVEINKSILGKLEKQKEILENESKKETSRD